MITKLCIVCLCMTASAMIGLAHMKNKKRRVSYFRSLVKLCDKLISEIAFRKENLNSILKEFASSDNTELSAHIGAFCDSPYSELKIRAPFLKADERKAVEDFFCSLGSTDSETQIFQLENHKRRFNEIYSDESEKFKKSGSMGLKLSVLLGIAAGILIL